MESVYEGGNKPTGAHRVHMSPTMNLTIVGVVHGQSFLCMQIITCPQKLWVAYRHPFNI